MVGMSVRADHEPDVLELVADLVEGSLELGERAGLVHAGIDEHDP
jgi:hypothetical protein